MDIEFGRGLLTDQPDYFCIKSGGAKYIENCLPYSNSYYPVLRPIVFNSTQINESTAGEPLYGFCLEPSDLIKKNFLFCSKKFYRFTSSSFTEITCYENEISNLCVINYGDWIIVLNGTNPPMVLKDPTGNTFEALGGSPPTAKYGLFFRGHLILANLVESSIAYPKRIRWSAREDVEDWAESLTTGADFQDFPDNIGQITGLAKFGDNFAILFEDSISIGAYSGGIYTFSFSHNLYSNVGCPYPKSIISIGNACYFFGKNSIYKLSGDGLSDIAYGRVRSFWQTNFDTAKNNKLSAIYLPERNLILWSFCSKNSDNPDYILAYNVIEDNFTIIKINHKLLLTANSSDIQYLDSMSTLEADSSNILIDNPTYTAMNIIPMIIDEDGYISCFAGEKMVAKIELPEIESYPEVIMLRGAKIRAEGTTAGSLSAYHRYSHNKPKSYNNTFVLRDDQLIDLRVSDRMITLILQLDDFDRLYPIISLDIVPIGRR